MKADVLLWFVIGIFIAVVSTALIFIGKPELLFTLTPLVLFLIIVNYKVRRGK